MSELPPTKERGITVREAAVRVLAEWDRRFPKGQKVPTLPGLGIYVAVEDLRTSLERPE